MNHIDSGKTSAFGVCDTMRRNYSHQKPFVHKRGVFVYKNNERRRAFPTKAREIRRKTSFCNSWFYKT